MLQSTFAINIKMYLYRHVSQRQLRIKPKARQLLPDSNRLEAQQNRLEQLLTNIAQAFNSFAVLSGHTARHGS